MRQRRITNIADYVFGVETGLDTNARKNRGGHTMEKTVETSLMAQGIDYEREMPSSQWPTVAAVLGTDEKRFDFAIKSKDKTYLTEVNYYNTGGSKLNEVARAYSEIAPKINALDGFEFVWITDGPGWLKAKNKLEEALQIIERVYNLATLPQFILELKKDGD